MTAIDWSEYHVIIITVERTSKSSQVVPPSLSYVCLAEEPVTTLIVPISPYLCWAVMYKIWQEGLKGNAFL